MRNEEELETGEIGEIRNWTRESVFLETEDPELGEGGEGMWETAIDVEVFED